MDLFSNKIKLHVVDDIGLGCSIISRLGSVKSDVSALVSVLFLCWIPNSYVIYSYMLATNSSSLETHRLFLNRVRLK